MRLLLKCAHTPRGLTIIVSFHCKCFRKEPEKAAEDRKVSKNSNVSACSCYQVTYRCSGDIAEAKRHNPDPTRLRRRRVYSDSSTAQDSHNWIFCDPSQQVIDSVSDACDGSQSEGVPSDVAGSQPQHTAAVMNILEMTKTQDDLWDSAMNGYVETSDFMHCNFSMDVFGDPWCDSVIVGASDGFGCSSLNLPVYAFLDSIMMGTYNPPDLYSKDDLNDVLDASSCDSCMTEPQVALCEPSMHAPYSFLHRASVKGHKVTLCDLTMSDSEETKDDFAMDSVDNAICDFTIDAPGENMGDCVVNDEENFTDENSIILGRSPCRLPHIQTEDSAQCAHKRDQRLSGCARSSFSSSSLSFVTETFSNWDQEEPVTMMTSCHCSQTNSHFVSTDSGYTLTHSKDEEGAGDGSGVPSSGIISVKKSQHSKTNDIRCDPVAESKYAGLQHTRGLIKVPEVRLSEDQPGDVLSSLVLTTLNGWNKGILDVQVHIPVRVLSLVGRWGPNNIHLTKLPGRDFLTEINAAGIYYQNYLSEIWEVGVQQYPVVLFIDQARFNSHGENIHGDFERRLAQNRLWRNTGETRGLDKIGMAPANLYNHRGQFDEQNRGGKFLEEYTPSEDKHTFLANNQSSLEPGLTLFLASRQCECGDTYFVSLVCPTLLFAESSASYLVRCHDDYLQNSRIVLQNSTTVLANCTIVLPQSPRVTLLTGHAIILKNALFETVSMYRGCLLYQGTNYADKNSPSGAQHRRRHASLVDAAIETDLNKHCVCVCKKTLPMLKTLQPAHVQRRRGKAKSVCRDKLSSRLCTKIKRAVGKEKSLIRAKPCPGGECLLSTVAKMVLRKRVTMPHPSAMFWLGTPLRSLYIGKRVGNGIRAHFSHAQLAHQRSNGSSMSKKKSKTSEHTDRNNNVNSDDTGGEDEDEEDDDDDDNKSIKAVELHEQNKITSEPVLLTITTTFIFISLGSTFLTKLADNMTYFDSYWFIWISVATIGYGDIVPTEQRLFLGILAYIFIGLCLMSNLISETSLFFSANVSKTRAITSDAVAIINTRKQLIVIQRRSERANDHWAILREKVLNKQIPHHLIEESNKYKAGLLVEEREMVRFAYKVYFKQAGQKYQPPVQDNATRMAPGIAPGIAPSVPADAGQGEEPDVYTDEAEDSVPDDQLSLLSEVPDVIHKEPDVRKAPKPNVWQKVKRATVNAFSGAKKKDLEDTPGQL